MASNIIIDNAAGGIETAGADITLPPSPTVGAALVVGPGSAYAELTAPPLMRNRIINGDMRVSQRFADAPVSPAGGTYTTDRWVSSTNMLNSVYFDGNGDYLSIANNAALQFGSGDFTFETWFYIAGNSDLSQSNIRVAKILCSQAGTNELEIAILGDLNTTGTGIRFSWYTGGAYAINENRTVSIAQNTWHHFAVSRSSNSIKMFLNGVQQGATVTSSANIAPTAAFEIGRMNLAGYLGYLNGYISNLRIVKGTALYTANFTPPTAPLAAIANTSLLTCAASTIIDLSTNNFTVTANGNAVVSTVNPFRNFLAGRMQGWSNYFDGNGDYLSVADNTALDVEASDFTIECWYYTASTITTDIALFSKRATPTWAGVLVVFDSNMYPKMYATTDGTSWGIAGVASSIACTVGAWNHIAMTRSGNTWSLWVNGSLGATASLAGNVPNNTAPFLIGAGAGDGTRIINQSYISNFRIVKGTSLYTANFTPSTLPLVPIANTSLLTCASSLLQDKSSNNFTITRNGDVAVSSISPFTAQAPPGFTGALRWSVMSPASAFSAQWSLLQHRIEGNSMSDFAYGTASARTSTLSFWVRSSVTGTFCVSLRNQAQNRSYVAEYTVSAQNTWERKTIVVSGDTTGTWLTNTGVGVYITWDLGSGTTYNTTAGSWQAGNFLRTTNQTNFIGTVLVAGATSNDFAITGVQLEAGSIATPFEVRPMQVETSLCQRYYARMRSLSGNYVGFGAGGCHTTTVGGAFSSYTTMRTSPVISINNVAVYDGAVRQVTAIQSSQVGTNSARVNYTSTGLTASRALVILGNNDPNASVELNAEL